MLESVTGKPEIAGGVRSNQLSVADIQIVSTSAENRPIIGYIVKVTTNCAII